MTLLTKQEAIEFARHLRYLKRGTWYVTKRGNVLTIIDGKLYRRHVHGSVVAIIGTA